MTIYTQRSGFKLMIIRTILRCTLGRRLEGGSRTQRLRLRIFTRDSWGCIGSGMRPGIGSTGRRTYASLLAKSLDRRMNRDGAPLCGAISFMPAKSGSADFLQSTATNSLAVAKVLLSESTSCRHGEGIWINAQTDFLESRQRRMQEERGMRYYLIYSTRHVIFFSSRFTVSFVLGASKQSFSLLRRPKRS